MENLSLSQWISRSGVVSRRKAAELVRAGRVAVDHEIVREPGLKVSPDACVTLDDVELKPKTTHYYIMLNKPRGYVSTNEDPHAKLKAVDLIGLADAPRLFSAGRLDKESEGLLIFSDDGEYVAKLTHPRYRIFKRYVVDLTRPLRAEEIRQMIAGIEDSGEILRAAAVTPVGKKQYEFLLNEGKKREIRRLTAHFGAPTVRLRRVAQGKLALGDLAEGKFRELSPDEVALSLISEEI